MDKLILFFDCYIVSRTQSSADNYTKSSFPRLAKMIGYRDAASTYRHVDKIEVVKYVLASYQLVHWDHVVIRFECEDGEESHDFAEYARKLFPWGEIVNCRSDSAEKYVASLVPLKRYGNPWIFYSPNNDHPLIGNPTDLLEAVRLAEDVERVYPEYVVDVLYSHFTESQSAMGASEHDWASFTRNHSSVIGETHVARIVKNSVLMCDSIKVFRLDFLLDAFGNTTNNGRLTRLEECGLYQSELKREITVCPTREVCRHYDSYMHAIETTPPLFIPNGFFERNIRVRFGFSDHLDGWVNLNPIETYSYLGGVADLRCFPSELPRFWEGRISHICYATDLQLLVNGPSSLFEAHAKLRNPYEENYFGDFYVQSAYRHLSRQGVPVPTASISVVKKLLRVGEDQLLTSSALGHLMVFVESGALVIGMRCLLRGEYLVISAEEKLCAANETTQLVIVRFN